MNVFVNYLDTEFHIINSSELQFIIVFLNRGYTDV
jgi:hypothetical protein